MKKCALLLLVLFFSSLLNADSWLPAAQTIPSPLAGANLNMAYDAKTGTIVGAWGSGGTGPIYYSQFNGTSWAAFGLVPRAPSAGAQYDVSLAYDAATQTVVAAWGDTATFFPYYSQFNGTSWTTPAQIPRGASTGASFDVALAYYPGKTTVIAAWTDTSSSMLYYSVFNGTSWTTAALVPLGASTGCVFIPTLTYNATNNRVFIAWSDISTNHPYYSEFDGTSWSTPGTIPLGAGTGANLDVSIADYPANGTMVATWSEKLSPFYVYYSVFNGTSWSTASAISLSSAISGFDVQVAYNPASETIFAVWPDFVTLKPHYSIFNSSTWTTPAALPPGTSGMVLQSVTLAFDNSSSQMLAGWVDATNTVYYSSYLTTPLPENIAWSSPTTLSTLGVNATTPQVGINQAGDTAVAVWVEGNNIRASVYNGTSWSAATTISTGVLNTQPQVAVDANGNATVVWINSSNNVTYSVRPAAGSFSAAATISGATNAISLSLAFDNSSANANVMAAWGDNVGGVAQGNIKASLYTFMSGTWSAVTQISASTNLSQLPTVAFYNGVAVAVWSEFVPITSTSTAYVVNDTNATVAVVNTSTNTISSTIGVATNPAQIAFTPDGKYAYVTNYTSSTISVIATNSNTVVSTISGFTNPQGIKITPNGKFAYVCNNGGTTVSVVSTSSNSIVSTVTAVGNAPADIVITPSGSIAYVCNNNDDDVVRIDLSTNMVTGATIGVGTTPNAMAISPSGSLVYVANLVDGTVSVINTGSNTVTNTITVGASPNGIAFTPNGNFAYVACNTVASVINTGTNMVTATITGISGGDGVAITPNGSFAYVCNFHMAANSLSVIDTSMNTIVSTITGFHGPFGIEMQPSFTSKISSNTFSSGAWGSPTTISNPSVNSINPSVTISTKNGRGFAIWYTYTLTGNAYTNVNVFTAAQATNFSWNILGQISTTSGIRNPSDLEARVAVDANNNLLGMYTNSFDGETFYMEYAYGVIGGGPPTGPLDLLQQNLYALSFGLGASSLGNNYYATMDYYINGGYTRIRSGEIDVTSYKPVWSYPAILSAKGTNNSSPYISVFPTPNGNIINAAVIWLSASGSNTVVQVTTGEEKKVQPPSNLAVTYGSTSVGVFTDLTATLTWTASSSSRAVAYNIYRDSIFVTQVPSTTLSYVDHNRDHSESGTYGVATINNQFSQSSTATITYFVP